MKRASPVQRTLLATDIEGFTRTVRRLGDGYGRTLIRTHNRLLRDCLQRNRGREVAHTGDGILAAFGSLRRAIACAAEMQRALQRYNVGHDDAPLRVRIGLHVGAPLPEEGRLFGSCVNETVRICSAAQAGRVLVSELVWQLATNGEFQFSDSGLFDLKGLDQPLHLYELDWSTGQATAPL